MFKFLNGRCSRSLCDSLFVSSSQALVDLYSNTSPDSLLRYFSLNGSSPHRHRVLTIPGPYGASGGQAVLVVHRVRLLIKSLGSASRTGHPEVLVYLMRLLCHPGRAPQCAETKQALLVLLVLVLLKFSGRSSGFVVSHRQDCRGRRYAPSRPWLQTLLLRPWVCSAAQAKTRSFASPYVEWC